MPQASALPMPPVGSPDAVIGQLHVPTPPPPCVPPARVRMISHFVRSPPRRPSIPPPPPVGRIRRAAPSGRSGQAAPAAPAAVFGRSRLGVFRPASRQVRKGRRRRGPSSGRPSSHTHPHSILAKKHYVRPRRVPSIAAARALPGRNRPNGPRGPARCAPSTQAKEIRREKKKVHSLRAQSRGGGGAGLLHFWGGAGERCTRIVLPSAESPPRASIQIATRPRGVLRSPR